MSVIIAVLGCTGCAAVDDRYTLALEFFWKSELAPVLPVKAKFHYASSEHVRS